MKIAMIIEQIRTEMGGAERSTAQIIRELTARGHRVTLLTGRAPTDKSMIDAEVRKCPTGSPSRGFMVWPFVSWCRRELANGGFDVSLSVTTTVPGNVLQPRAGIVREAQLRSVARRTSAVARAVKRGSLLLSPKQGALRRFEKKALHDPMVKRVVAISRYMARQFKAHYQLPDDRIELIPNAAEMPELSDDERQTWRRRVRQGLNLADDVTTFLFVANDPLRKGALPLMDAMRDLARRDRPVVLLVAGPMSYMIHKISAAFDMRDRVIQLGPTSHIGELYCAADVTVLPTYYDPSSKVVIESLMMGTPAITTIYNGAADFVENPDGDARGRVLDDPNDVPSLVRVMEELTDPDVRLRCADATVGMADQLTMHRHVEKLEALLIDVAEEVRTGQRASRSLVASG